MLFPHLVLGTAQLGLSYGIANKIGQPDQDVSTAIIREAWNGGIQEGGYPLRSPGKQYECLQYA